MKKKLGWDQNLWVLPSVFWDPLLGPELDISKNLKLSEHRQVTPRLKAIDEYSQKNNIRTFLELIVRIYLTFCDS